MIALALKGLLGFVRGLPLWVYFALAGAVGVYLYGEHQQDTGRAEVQAEWNAQAARKIAAEQAAVMKRQAENAADTEAQKEINRLLKKGHANETAQNNALRADRTADSRLRLPVDVCDGPAGPTEASSASGGIAAASAARFLPEQIESDLRDLMLQADTVVAGCRVAQGFIVDNGLAP